MDICNIPSVQRVVNFTPNNGKMLRAEQPQAKISGVTMICDLPLLFINGLPTCLENLTRDQLEKFVPYMINCSGATTWTKPKWWPNEINFSGIPMREYDMSDGKWLSALKRLVVSCYSYYGCDYALRLCAKTAHKCHSEWILVDGLNGTMYLYNKVTRKISSAFKSANVTCSKRRGTFSNIAHTKSNDRYGSMLSNKQPIQIYLCDTCDLEFRTLEGMQVHEKKCSKKSSLSIMNTQECISAIPINRVPNIGMQVSILKRQETARMLENVCPSQYLKKQSSMIYSCDDSRKRQNRQSYVPVCKSCGNNLDSWKEIRIHGTSCMEIKNTTTSSLHSSGPVSLKTRSFRSEKHDPHTKSTSAIGSVSRVKSSLAKEKRMSLIPCMQNQQALSTLRPHRDVYLCNQCDEEFSCSSEARLHETNCKGRTELIPSPVVSVGENYATQEYVLRYLHLSSSLNPCPVSRGRAWFRNPKRYSSIPISSPLGRLIHGRTQVPIATVSSKMENVERYCPAKPTEVFKPMRTKQNTDDWKVSWKLHKNTTENSIHSYLYPTQRWWKMPLLRKMQMKEEKKLKLLKRCKSVQLSVRRMTDLEIQNYSSCRNISVRVKKLSLEEIRLHTNIKHETTHKFKVSFSTSPESIAKTSLFPKIKMLNYHQIQKYLNKGSFM